MATCPGNETCRKQGRGKRPSLVSIRTESWPTDSSTVCLRDKVASIRAAFAIRTVPQPPQHNNVPLAYPRSRTYASSLRLIGIPLRNHSCTLQPSEWVPASPARSSTPHPALCMSRFVVQHTQQTRMCPYQLPRYGPRARPCNWFARWPSCRITMQHACLQTLKTRCLCRRRTVQWVADMVIVISHLQPHRPSGPTDPHSQMATPPQ